MQNYPALVSKEAGSDYGVEFPDFPGCVSAAKSLDDVSRQAVEALDLHVRGMREDGEAIPEPTSLERVLEIAEAKGAAAFLVPLRQRKSKAVPITMTIDEILLEAIDAAARRSGTTRSGFFADAARRILEADAAHK